MMKVLIGGSNLLLIALGSFFWWWFDQTFLRLNLKKKEIIKPWSSLTSSRSDGGIVKLDWNGQRPLKFLFMGWGSRGDHQPNLALGLELARRGHFVTILGMEKYRDIFTEYHDPPRITYVPLKDSRIWELASAMASSDGADFLKRVVEYVDTSARELVPQYMTLGADADVLIGQHGCTTILPHMSVAEALRKPIFFVTHDVTLPTSSYSFNPQENRVQDYGPKTNVWNHRVFGLIFGIMTTLVANPNSVWRSLRSELGLKTPFPFMDPLQPEKLASVPTFYTYDPILWPPPYDQSPHWYPTGYFVTRDDNDSFHNEAKLQRNQELQEWIDARRKKAMDDGLNMPRPIVYLGQGSWDMHNRKVFTDALMDALDHLEMDAIALASTLDNDRAVFPDHIKVVDQLDQTTFFPQCHVIVHHGGAGTSSQCILSGKPGICMPAMPFQEAWGGQLAHIGAGILLRPNDFITAWGTTSNDRTNLLLQAIQQAMTPEIQQKAAELAVKSNHASGRVEFAADKILDYLEQFKKEERQENENYPEKTSSTTTTGSKFQEL